ncbi:MAG: MlaD family protein, partial [Candidatus Aminicenantales bacterium]
MSIFKRKKKEDPTCLEESRVRALRQEVKIGIFLTGTLIILALFIFVVGDFSTLFRKEGYTLLTRFDSVAGLEKRTVVRLAGVKIGFVQDIRLKGRQAEVALSISPDVQVPRGSRATLASLGLLGEKYVEIIPGEDPAMLRPGETIGSIPAVTFDQLGIMLTSIGEEIRKTSQALRALIGEESRANLEKSLENLSRLSTDLSTFVRENRGGLDRSLETSARAFDNFDERTEAISRNLEELIQMIREMVEENRGRVGDNLKAIQTLLEETEESLKLLNASLEKINKGEGSLGKLVQDPDLYERTRDAVDGIQRMITPVSSLRVQMRLRAEYFGDSGFLKSAISLKFWPSAETFLLAQVVHDPWQDRFVYTAQGGIRWGPLSPRAGVFESEFGLGLDVHALED